MRPPFLGASGRRRWRGAASLACLMLLLGSQPACCTLGGYGLGVLINAAEPGPYEKRPVPQSGDDAPARLDVERGDTLRIVLRSGQQMTGEYRRLKPPNEDDLELYLVLRNDDMSLRYVPVSDVSRLDVEVTDYTPLIGGAAIGLILDVILINAALNALGDWFGSLST
jgi:hypothetical protein